MTDWISVKDRLPEYGDEVLACFPSQLYDDVCVGMTQRSRTVGGPDVWSTGGAIFELDRATHWMPLPDPPK